MGVHQRSQNGTAVPHAKPLCWQYARSPKSLERWNRATEGFTPSVVQDLLQASSILAGHCRAESIHGRTLWRTCLLPEVPCPAFRGALANAHTLEFANVECTGMHLPCRCTAVLALYWSGRCSSRYGSH